MTIRSKIYLAVLVIVCVEKDCLGQFVKPVIQTWGTWSDSEHTVSPNIYEDFLCLGNKPLKWKFPETEESQRRWTKFLVVSEKPADEKYSYGLRLFIKNMSYPYVGEYCCHYQDSTRDNPATNDKVYLFLDDYNRLSISDPDSITNLTLRKGEVAILPCRRTSSNVKLEVFALSTDEKIQFNVPRENNTIYIFDESRGIITNDTYKDEIFICKYQRENRTTLHYVQLQPEIAKPLLKSNNITDVGETLNLRCSVKSNTYVYFSWKIPNGTIKDRRVTITNSQNDERQKIYWQDLSINNTIASDSGVYTCTVLDYFDHSASVSTTIKLSAMSRRTIFLEEAPTSDYFTQTLSDKDRIEWRVNVRGSPKLKVNWSFSNDTTTIPLENGNKYKINFDAENLQAVLVIRNINSDDVGTYNLIASNGFEKEYLYFYITPKELKHPQDQIMNFKISECIDMYVLSLSENKKYEKKIQDLFVNNLFHKDIIKIINSLLEKDGKIEEKQWFNQCLTSKELYDKNIPDFRTKLVKCKTELTSDMLKTVYLPTTCSVKDVLSTKEKLISSATKMIKKYCEKASNESSSNKKNMLIECFLALKYSFCINDIYEYLSDK